MTRSCVFAGLRVFHLPSPRGISFVVSKGYSNEGMTEVKTGCPSFIEKTTNSYKICMTNTTKDLQIWHE